MMRSSKLARALAALAVALITPALAARGQGSSQNLSATATVQPDAGTPSQRNPLLADNGTVRMSKLVGTDVYNVRDQKLGSVDDVLMGSNGQPEVIVSAGGKLVQVPWNQLYFGNAKLNSHNRVILPDATTQSLQQAPEFRYTGGR